MRACTKFGGGECKDLNLARLPKARALAEARQNEACCYCCVGIVAGARERQREAVWTEWICQLMCRFVIERCIL